MKISTAWFCLLLVLLSCGGEVIPDNPVRKMQRKFEPGKAYTVILSDMDLQGSTYKHRYKRFEIGKNGKVTVKKTGWQTVDDAFFALHENDLGMEVLSQNRKGRVNNLVTPPGFSNFIGDTTYGNWVPIQPDSLSGVQELADNEWRFKKEYAWLPSALGVENTRVSWGEYSTYDQLYRYNRPFYGEVTADSVHYGTHSPYMHYYYPGFYTRMRYKNNFVKPHGVSYHGTGRGGGGFGK